MKIRTTLLSGAGNTFHIIEDQEKYGFFNNPLKRKEFAKRVCETDTADGFIFLKKDSTSKQYRWDFYNNDGSDAEMCGNATRCVGYFIKNEMKDASQEIQLDTKAGLIKVFALPDNQFRVIMTAITETPSSHGFFCNTGVPHLVLEIDDFSVFRSLKEKARLLRQHKDFAPAGTNVTYVTRTSVSNTVKAVSYERGVEDFTEACGTGAMAAAFYNFKKYSLIETNVEMPGGTLIMTLNNLEKPIMTGPAQLLGTYEYEI